MRQSSESRTSFVGASVDESALARVLEELPKGKGHHRAIVDVDDQRLCLSVAPASAVEDDWPAFSAVASRRAALRSDRLLPLVASGRYDGKLYAAYELHTATPLSEYRETAELSTARCLAFLVGISRALDDAVSQGQPPHAATPESVFVEARHGAMLADLGLAREALGNPPRGSDRMAAWIAPEVLRGEGAHERSPVYSFGALAFTMLTGASPGDPGHLTELRPDLPEALEVVLTVCMAPDPRKRYGTSAEARHLVNLVIYGAGSGAAGQQVPSRFARMRPRAKAAQAKAPAPPKAKTPRLPRPSALSVKAPRLPSIKVPQLPSVKAPRLPSVKAPRLPRVKAPRLPAGVSPRAALERLRLGRARRLAVPALVVGGAVAVGALAGALIGGSGDSSPPTPQHAAAGGLSLTLPEGWHQARATGATLAARPEAAPGSGLTVSVVGDPVTPAEQTTPVKLGTLEAWRSPASGAVRYVIPTDSGKVLATCAATPAAGASLLATCERAASTLRLSSVKNVPLESVVREDAERWRLAAGRLRVDRAAGLRRLAAAARPFGQVLSARSLARAYDRAQRRFAPLPGGGPAAQAAHAAAQAYRALAAAADGQSAARWNAARADVRRAEAAVAQAVAAAA
jgi:hypothetical protein